MPIRTVVVVGVSTCALLACSSPAKSTEKPAAESDTKASKATPTVDVFDPNRVLSIQITLPDKDWDALRNKGRDASELATSCRSLPKKIYPFYRAKVTIDGISVADVGVRKKGFLGSLSVLRPSLKLKFGAFVKGQHYRGVRRMTLNNNKQDPSLMRQCLVYKVFRDAKLPAPRCNFARVSVNGTELGIYSNVEPIKKPFLRRHFRADTGNLYEGQIADFSAPLLGKFEQKTNLDEIDRSALAKLMAALGQGDAALVSAVSSVIDYDRFLTFWALESLTGHWDGYTSNRNNVYIYADPTGGKLHFIPWGPDIGFTNADPFNRGRPASVSASAVLARRLYANPAVRAAYVARMGSLLSSVWNEKALLAEVERIDRLLGGAPKDDGVTEIRGFITKRRASISKELASGGAEWKVPSRDDPCFTKGSAISGTFATTFGNLGAGNPMAEGKATLTFSLGGTPIKLTMVGAVSGRDKNTGSQAVVRLVGMSGSSIYVLQLFFEEPLFKSGVTQPFHGFATWGLLIELVNMRTFKLRGFLGGGRIALEQAGTSKGAAIKGTVSGTIYERASARIKQ